MVELTPEAQKALLSGTGVGNGPSFIMPPVQLANGVIEVDLAARINGKGRYLPLNATPAQIKLGARYQQAWLRTFTSDCFA